MTISVDKPRGGEQSGYLTNAGYFKFRRTFWLELDFDLSVEGPAMMNFQSHHTLMKSLVTKQLAWRPRLSRSIRYLIYGPEFLVGSFDAKRRCLRAGFVWPCFVALSAIFFWSSCRRLFWVLFWDDFRVAGIGLRNALWWHFLIREQLWVRVHCTSFESSSSCDII